MKNQKEFPRTYRSSSAAYRAIRQYEEKNGKQNFKCEKLDVKVFHVTNEPIKTLEERIRENLTIKHGELSYRYFPDGVHGEGYYELKTGDRRRPNSLHLKPEVALGV